MKIVANAAVDGDGGTAYRRAIEKVEHIYERLRSPVVPVQRAGRIHPAMDTDMPVSSFLGPVKTTKRKFSAGAVFQAYLFHAFSPLLDSATARATNRALASLNQ